MTASIIKEKLKRYLPLSFVILAVFLVTIIVQILQESVSFSIENAVSYTTIDATRYYVVNPYVSILFYMACILAMFLPIYTFSYRYSRTSEDIVFSLPIHRKKLILIEVLVSYIQVAGTYTIAYLLYVLLTLSKSHDGLFYPGFLLFYVVALVMIAIYLFAGSAIALLSRSVTEAVLIHICLNCALLLLTYGLNIQDFSLTFTLPLIGFVYIGNVFVPLIGYTAISSYLDLTPIGLEPSVINWYNQYLGSFICVILLALTFIPVFMFLIDKQKSEDSGLPNNSFIGIRTILPAAIIIFNLALGYIIGGTSSTKLNLLLWCPVMLIVHIVLYMISRKKIKFTLELGIGLGLNVFTLVTTALALI